MTYEYFIKSPFDKKPALLANYNGERVNLLGESYDQKVTDIRTGTSKEVTHRGITPEELADLYENVEKYGNYRKLIGKREVLSKKRTKAESSDTQS